MTLYVYICVPRLALAEMSLKAASTGELMRRECLHFDRKYEGTPELAATAAPSQGHAFL